MDADKPRRASVVCDDRGARGRNVEKKRGRRRGERGGGGDEGEGTEGGD